MLLREPAIAGAFYELNPKNLRKQIENSFNHSLGPKGIKEEKVIGAIVPHAGYLYSGHVAAWSYSRIPKANYLILGPNHYGVGPKFSIMIGGTWKTPLNGVEVDEEMARKLMDNCPLLESDFLAHKSEHSIEVQLPFLQHRFKKEFKFVPISVMNKFPSFDFLEECRVIGKAIAKVVKKQKKKWMLISSSDFSHYVPQERARSDDEYVIDAILRLDERDFFARLQEKNASICGFGPIAINIVASKELGAKKGKLLKYSTSGDIIGDRGSVVGYSSIIFK